MANNKNKMSSYLWSIKGWTHRRGFLHCVVFVILTCFFVYLRIGNSSFARSIRFQIEFALTGVKTESNVFPSTCHFPNLPPWMNETRHFFEKLPPSLCDRNPMDILVILEDGILKIDPTSKAFFERNETGNSSGNRTYGLKRGLTCKKWIIYRKDIENDEAVLREMNNFTEFDNETVMDSEFAKVECTVNGSHPIYSDYFYSILEKPVVEASCASNAARFMSECRPPDCFCRHIPKDEPRLSVMVVGVDSVSKANFLRLFPQTHQLLTGSHFSAVDFEGYNKVGLNTFPCLMPYLTGQSEEELTKGCWGGYTHFFDKCTTLFDVFASAGHRTAFVENMVHFDLFTYLKLGFRRKPAHYYGRPIYLPVKKFVRSYSSSGCWRGMADDEHILNWARLFQKTFADRLHFGHFWVNHFTHDDINEAQWLDPPLSQLLRDLEPLVRNSTLLIVMSDHGLRFGPFRQTEFGRLEENLPFMYMIFPQWFREKYKKAMRNLAVNRHRLVTTHDLHATLLDIINCNYNGGDEEASHHQRAVSLFHKVSLLRTCKDADIPDIYCSCQKGEEMDPTSSTSSTLALFVVGALNTAISGRNDQCEELRLESIVSVTRMVDPTSGAPPGNGDEDFVVMVRVAPGNATFEARVVKHRGMARVHPDIRRVSRYDDDSWCIQDSSFLKSLCICKVQGS